MITKYDFNKKMSLLMFILGLTLFIYPLLQDKLNAQKHEAFIDTQMDIIKEDIKKEEKKQEIITPIPDSSKNEQVSEEKPINKYDKLYEDLQKYNEELYKIGQNNLLDPFMFEVPTIKLSDYDIPTDIFGYISIPAMDIELPIYLGASKENMKLGATYLATTSYPIGGINTNTVICAHRGFSTQAMFRNIERLEVGDKITITNFWDTLTYEVTSFAVIYPDQVNNIFIQEGEDMLTLSTCHPYRQNYQRYIVYCKRIYIKNSEA